MPNPESHRQLLDDLACDEGHVGRREGALAAGLEAMRERRRRRRVHRALTGLTTLFLVALIRPISQRMPAPDPQHALASEPDAVDAAASTAFQSLTDEQLIEQLGSDRPYMIVGTLDRGEIVFLD